MLYILYKHSRWCQTLLTCKASSGINHADHQVCLVELAQHMRCVLICCPHQFVLGRVARLIRF